MNTRTILISLVIIISMTVSAFCELIVKAEIENTRYSVGDLIPVRVCIEENTAGFNSIYFDLAYDSGVLFFEGLTEGDILRNEAGEDEFVWAHSDTVISGLLGSHIITSFSKDEDGVLLYNTGTLMELRFRVIAQGEPTDLFQFTFQSNGAADEGGNEITDIQWVDSGTFSIGPEDEGAFIHISSPYENQVFYGDSILVDVIGTENPDYYGYIENREAGYASEPVSMAGGSILGESVPLVYGFNEIAAVLRDAYNNLLAMDTVLVYRSTDDKYVSIISPPDHAFQNSDMAEVFVSSSFDDVQVNGLQAARTGETIGENRLFHCRLWLKPGFNKITATATGPEPDFLTYTDTIHVYYEKGAGIFNFTLPLAGTTFKPAAGANLFIKGELDSLYRYTDEPGAGGAVMNRVALSVLYKPLSYIKEPYYLVEKGEAVLKEQDDSAYGGRARYVFYSNFEIPLEGLEKGEIEIIAYRNREGETWEDKITRTVFIDDSSLRIELLQPNVFHRDILDTTQQIRNFNENTDMETTGNITVSVNGAITLGSENDLTLKDEGLQNAADMIQTPDRNLYALVNAPGDEMKIYKKTRGNDTWEQVLSRDKMYGYVLCHTDRGILVGVSNLYPTTNSGLFLFENGNLTNLSFDESIQHVQFIEYRNGTVYIYGNYYSFLYSFNIFSLVEREGKQEVPALSRENFSNNYNIEQFILSGDTKAAVIRTDSGAVYLYRKVSADYVKVNLPELGGSHAVSGENVLYGEYTNGDYRIYLIKKDANMLEVIMEHKYIENRYYRSGVNLDDWFRDLEDIDVIACGFADDAFSFLYKEGDHYIMNKGQVFFDRFYQEDDVMTCTTTYPLEDVGGRLFISPNGNIFTGIESRLNQAAPGGTLCLLYNKYESEGSCSFHYVNDDIEGIIGFGFEVDPFWLSAGGALELGFEIREKQGESTQETDPVIVSVPPVSLADFLELTDPDFTLSSHYDAAKMRNIIHAEFTSLQKNRYLCFTINLRADSGDTSPALFNLTVHKKIMAKICAAPDEDIVLPIHGYVYDQTTEEVYIQHAMLKLEQDGSFFYDYCVNSQKQFIPIEISCSNSAGEYTSISFIVEVIISQNGILEVTYKDGEDDIPLTYDPGTGDFVITTTTDVFSVSGKYYGLSGLAAGYETYGYNYDGGDETLVLLERDLFETQRDDSVLDLVEGDFGPGYEGGFFTDQEIKLLPGKQRLVLYCENPGGHRAPYTVNDTYPDIIYNMPEGEQQIIFNLDEPAAGEVEGVPVSNMVVIDAFENQGPPFVFSRSHEITGEIRSLYNFSDLVVKSFTDGLVFENGEQEIIIQVEAGNRFTIPFVVTMDDGLVEDFFIGVIPTIPFLTDLKKAVLVRAKKSYTGAYMVPDFSGLDPDNWTEEQAESMEIPVIIMFNRNDIPVPENTKATLTLNYETSLSGMVDVFDNDYYCMKSDAFKIISLPKEGIKEGKNRLSWVFQYIDPVTGNISVISSSHSGRPGMHDFIFDFYNETDVVLTEIGFSEDLNDSYYNDDDNIPPSLELTKDKRTTLAVFLNDKELSVTWNGAGDGDEAEQASVSLLHPALKQGKNSLTVTYSEFLASAEETQSFSFLYDTLPPSVKIDSYLFDYYTTLDRLSCVITEANFEHAYLFHDTDIINIMPDISLAGDGKYRASWENIAGYGIVPSTDFPVMVRVYDKSGKYGDSDTLTGFESTDFPGDIPETEVPISLPLYQGTPALENEANYTAMAFPQHTKIAPKKFLKQRRVQSIIEENEDFLIRNNKTVFKDFNDGLSTGWIEYDGTWAVTSGVYVATGGNGCKSVLELTNFGDFTFEGLVRVSNTGSAGLIFCVQNPGSGLNAFEGYYAGIDPENDRVVLFAHNNDEAEIANYTMPLDLNTFYHMKIVRMGESIRVYVEDMISPVITVTDDSFESGNIGARAVSVSASFDDIQYAGTLMRVQKIMPDGDNGEYGSSVSIYGNTIAITSMGISDDWDNIYLYKINNETNNWEKDISFFWYGSFNWIASVFIGIDKFVLTAIDSYSGIEVFRKDAYGNWNIEQPVDYLLSTDWSNDLDEYTFGQDICLNNDYLLVGYGINSNMEYFFSYKEEDGSFYPHQQLNIGLESIIEGDIASYGDYAIVGAPMNNERATNAGAAYVFKKSDSGNWGEVQKIAPSDLQENDYFGTSVSVFDSTAIIGAGNMMYPSQRGGSYIFELNDEGVWMQTCRLYPDGCEPSDYFGASVAIAGNYAFVGAPGDDQWNGSVYLYMKENGQWIKKNKIRAFDNNTDSLSFGTSISLFGDTAVVGAPWAPDYGAAYIYTLYDKAGDARDDFVWGTGEKDSYFVVQVEKDPSLSVETIDDIRDAITFDLVGYTWNYETGDIGEVTQQLVFNTAEKAKYAERGDYLYYIVETGELQEQFGEQKSLLFPGGDAGPGLTIIDSGSLRVSYPEEWGSFTPYDMYITGENDSAIDDIIVYDPGYGDPGFDPGEDWFIPLHPELDFPQEDYSFTNAVAADAFSLTFWLRLEDEKLNEDSYGNKIKTVLTLNDNGGAPLLSLGYEDLVLNLFDETGAVPAALLDEESAVLLSAGRDAWYLCCLVFNGDEQDGCYLYVSDICKLKVPLSDPLIVQKILEAGAVGRFGPRDGEEYNTGFSSIAGPFYINRQLTDAEVARLFCLRDEEVSDGSSYVFADMTSDFGSEPSLLRVTDGSDYFTEEENADYTGTQGNGSLRACKVHRNLLTTIPDGQGGNLVILGDAGSFIQYNLDVTGGAASFTLTPKSTQGGVYYFGDRHGNYGLGFDRWYSVAGYVESCDAQADAKLVLSINGEAQEKKLSEGYFHFIYNNKSSLVPAEVKLFIETKGSITLKNDMCFNEGNYIIPQTLEKTAAKTLFAFDLSGTIHFLYKPLISNNEGYVNYETVLIDSEYVRIGTEIDISTGDAVYYAYIKNETENKNEWFKLLTNAKVTCSWQHIQLSYSHEFGMVSLYVDGGLAAKRENTSLPVFGSLEGTVPPEDNVYIGRDREGLLYAEGYMDNVVLSKYYMSPQYDDKRPLLIQYNKDTRVITIEESIVGPEQISSMRYTLESVPGGESLFGTTFPINTSALVAGQYRLTTLMVINGRRFKDILSFTVDNKPGFALNSYTPVIFRNFAADVLFDFCYDRSLQISGETLVYAGLGLKISFNGGTDEHIQYIVQDFIGQDPGKWLSGIEDGEGNITWSGLASGNTGNLHMSFPGIASSSDIACGLKYFYFTDTFGDTEKFDNITGTDESFTIPMASITVPIVPEKDADGDEYKIIVEVGGSPPGEVFIDYMVEEVSTGVAGNGSWPLTAGKAELYYDDILPEYGIYDCTLRLRYQGVVYAQVEDIILDWHEKKDDDDVVTGIAELEIEEFSLLQIDKETDEGSFYLKFYENGVGSITATIEIIQGGLIVAAYDDLPVPLLGGFEIYQNIVVPKGISTVRITLSASGFRRTSEIGVDNSVDPPQLVITNWVDSRISYNNVLFSWKGYYKGEFNDGIEYSYNFDGSGWTTPNSEWRSVRFYNLDEGYHQFKVKAIYKGVTSAEHSVTFLVDINRPVFDPDIIELEKLYNEDDVFCRVNIIGKEGAITDASLYELFIAGKAVTFNEDGSFLANDIAITKDGVNDFVLTAYDNVGNVEDHIVKVENRITDIIFPEPFKNIRYAPVTIVGRVREDVPAGLSLYLFDPFCATKGENGYSGWRKATINEDRTFFVEDVLVNPGTESKEILTTLRLACVFDSGVSFEREIDVRANEVTMPIEMDLSARAVEGEHTDIDVEIACRANVGNISSWSIDFDGDGIYDRTELEGESEYTWTHSYSSLGMVEPRVRIITKDKHFFSVTGTIIIHEKIREASNKIMTHPISLAVLRYPDNSSRVFVLRKDLTDYVIEAYMVPRNDDKISYREYTINLTMFGIEDPVKIFALDEEHLYVAENRDNQGHVYALAANEFSNYEVKDTYAFNGEVHDLTGNADGILISFTNRDSLLRIPLVDNLFDKTNTEEIYPEIEGAVAVDMNSGIDMNGHGILLADYFNQRILRLTPAFRMDEQFGSPGNGEGEFVKPAIITSCENRIFVYDEGRNDIQVFDNHYQPVCTLAYNPDPEYNNYIDPEFLLDLADIEIITKQEGNMLYYYALLLSRSSEKLALLRLPQWEELRARVRNNKIVFIQNGEVYTAKPDGSDLKKILSSDSIPLIKGTLDYPALSPDGRTLAFTSRMVLYNAGTSGEGDGTSFYDHLYTVNIETKELKRINLGIYNGYEIERPVFNSNGDRLIFSAKKSPEKWHIYIYDMKTGLPEPLFTEDLVSAQANTRFPYYSPDDRFVVFTTDYDGDEDIEIVDTEDLTMRVEVTSNFAPDSLPVWNTIYPFEISNTDLKIESKIAFVSGRDFRKGVYYVYLARKSESDIRVVFENGDDTYDNPDAAAIEITSPETEGDYPCFTGDGTALVFEYFDGQKGILKKYDMVEEELTNMDLPGSAVRPAGMKNMITNFQAENADGDGIALSWDRYTDCDIDYIVQFGINAEGEPLAEKRVSSQTGTLLRGLEMDVEYIVRVCIRENMEEAAVSEWKKVKIPAVVARPTYEIDENNPYLVKLHAWKPTPETDWSFTWFIDNQETPALTSQDHLYEFATSGAKTVHLRVSDKANTAHDDSDPMEIMITSDIDPVIEYTLADDSSYIELSAENSKGKKINFASTGWLVSGPGGVPAPAQGSRVIIPLNTFRHRINVNLSLQRIPVTGQSATDTIEKNLTIDLDLKEVIPVIEDEADQSNPLLIKFSGEHSKGNIDWYRAQWTVFGDGDIIHMVEGVSTFQYLFPERNDETIYTVSLTVPRVNDGLTETVSRVISLEGVELRPQIDHTILTLQEGGNVVGAKLLLDCTQSVGSSIDFSSARWVVPVAGSYNEQATQFGPTAVYNLFGTEEGLVVEVSLTLSRKGGIDPTMITKLIKLDDDDEIGDARLVVNKAIENTATGKALILDALSSTGPNIDWEKTEWVIDSQYTRKGPVARLDIPASAEKEVVFYTCTLYRYGRATPETVKGEVNIENIVIIPLISTRRLSEEQNRMYELSVLDTEGVNIDWERTDWYIYDGNENVIQRRGAVVTHAFAAASEQMGYPVMVEIFLKGSSFPFVGYATIDVEGDELIPMIRYDTAEDDPLVFLFSADASKGSNIDWNQAKWAFGDSSESQYGPAVSHKFPAESQNKTYRISLTLTRRSANGITETKTAFRDITIGSDEIKPVITARLYKNNNLILSAEESEGRGLMLDRSLWLFEGKGDSQSSSVNVQTGVIRRESHTSTGSHSRSETELDSTTISGETGFNIGNLFSIGGSVSHTFGEPETTSSTTGYSDTVDTTTYDRLKNNSESFSTSNTHTGAVCRRYVSGRGGTLLVTLFVYRMKTDGGMEGESITVNIDLDNVKIRTESNDKGVIYGK